MRVACYRILSPELRATAFPLLDDDVPTDGPVTVDANCNLSIMNQKLLQPISISTEASSNSVSGTPSAHTKTLLQTSSGTLNLKSKSVDLLQDNHCSHTQTKVSGKVMSGPNFCLEP